MNLLIAFDGSEPGEAAIDDLCRAGLPAEATALVVSVAEVWLPPVVDESDANNVEVNPTAPTPAVVKQMWARSQLVVKQAEELAERASTRIQHIFPKWTTKAEAGSGSPAWEILRLSNEWTPDLVVVGSQGKTALSSLVLGSVSQKILTEASCSVRIGRGKMLVGEPPQTIIVAVDGSSSSFVALREVARRNWIEGSEIHVVVVYDEVEPSLIGRVMPPVAEMVGDLNQSQREWAEQIAEKALAEFSDSKLAVKAVVEAGNPKKFLASYADEVSADSIFLGATGVSGTVERLLLGSVSSAVAARANCSVEVVRQR